jgi:3-hydroxyisobutyrate dehydrogenase
MGQPMALNLVRAAVPLVVWNRTPQRCELLREAGAVVAADVVGVFARTRVVVLMLASDAAIDAVLGRGGRGFGDLVDGHLLIHMGTTSPEYSRALGEDIRTAGGHYVEAPVSGSRVPAEQAQLVAMVAGDAEDRAFVRSLLQPMCARVFDCGVVPSALLMKLAVNLFLITMVTGLVEAFHFAEVQQIDRGLLAAILAAGPMSSAVSRVKADKLVAGDYAVQASITDVLKNNRLIAEAARRAELASPLLDVCHALFRETRDLGHGAEDMAAVLRALQARTELGLDSPVRRVE